jgi:hypothetical protein
MAKARADHHLGRQALCRRVEMGFCGVIVKNVPQRQQINGLIV